MLAHIGVFNGRAGFQLSLARQFQQLGIVNAAALPNGKALVHQRCQGNLPALAHIAKTLAVGHAHIGEEHFVKVRLARYLLDGSHFNARRLHVEEEKCEPLMLGRGRVRAGDNDAVIAIMRARRPDLLAVNYPIVTIALGFGAKARNVRTGRRLGK